MKNSVFYSSARVELEILHRAKPLGGGGWVYGYYFKCQTCKGRTVHAIRPLELNAEECYFNSATPSGIEVDPETVGTYIGECDKQGQKIFTGDILEASSRKHFPTTLIVADVRYCFIIGTNFEEYTVIGNVVENVELLEQFKKGTYRNE